VTDQWEALFDLWHERAHRVSQREKRRLFEDLEDLERRVILLEAFMSAKHDPEPIPVYRAPRVGPFAER